MAVAAAAFAALMGRAGRAQEPAASGKGVQGPVVAVVDMPKLLRGSAQWRDLAAQEARMLDDMQRVLAKLGRQVQVLRNEQANLPPGTDEARKKEADLQQAVAEHERTRRDLEAQIARQHNEAVRTILDRIGQAVGSYAQEHGVDLVLKKQSLNVGGPETVEQNLLMVAADVLYASPALDVSEAVIQKLNATYEAPIQVK
jgi:Skp family chaperone for outer membrane proteins